MLSYKKQNPNAIREQGYQSLSATCKHNFLLTDHFLNSNRPPLHPAQINPSDSTSYSINPPTSPPIRAIYPPRPRRLLPRPPCDSALEFQQRTGHLVTNGCLATLMMDGCGSCSDDDGWLGVVAAMGAARCSLAAGGGDVGVRFAVG